jgi:hypothetical protein
MSTSASRASPTSYDKLARVLLPMAAMAAAAFTLSVGRRVVAVTAESGIDIALALTFAPLRCVGAAVALVPATRASSSPAVCLRARPCGVGQGVGEHHRRVV